MDITMHRKAVLIEIEGKFYACRKIKGKGGARAGIEVFKYEEVNKEDYLTRIDKLASLIASSPAVQVKDVIKGALSDYPLDVLDDIEKDLAEALKQAEESKETAPIKTREGHCCDVVIGKKILIQLRE